MPISGATDYTTLTGARNFLARQLGTSAYSNLDADTQSRVDDALAMALDQVPREASLPELRRPATLSTVGPYSTGTVSVTAGSATVTGSGTLWTASSNVLIHDKFVLGTTGAFRVNATPSSDTSLTLSSVWTGSTASGQSYAIGRDEYFLPAGFVRLLKLWDIEEGGELELWTPEEMTRRTGGRYTTGRPVAAALVGGTATTDSVNQRLQFYPVPDGRRAYGFSYLSLPTWPSATFEVYAFMDVVLAKAMSLLCIIGGEGMLVQRREWEQEYASRLRTLIKQQDRAPRTRIVSKNRYVRSGGPGYFPTVPDVFTGDQ